MAGSQFNLGGAIQGAGAGFKGGGPWGALAGGIAGGFGDFIKSGGDNSDYAKHPITKIVKDAQRAGVHPLFALGAGVNWSPMFQAGDTSQSDGAATAVGNIAHMFSSEQTAKATAGIEGRVAESVIRRNDAAAARDVTESQLAVSNDAMNREELKNRQRDRIGVMLDEAMSKNDGVFGPVTYPPAMIQVQMPDGSLHWIPNQNVMETGEALGAGYSAYGAGKTVKGIVPGQASAFRRYKQKGGFDYKSYGNTGSKRGKSALTSLLEWLNK